MVATAWRTPGRVALAPTTGSVTFHRVQRSVETRFWQKALLGTRYVSGIPTQNGGDGGLVEPALYRLNSPVCSGAIQRPCGPR